MTDVPRPAGGDTAFSGGAQGRPGERRPFPGNRKGKITKRVQGSDDPHGDWMTSVSPQVGQDAADAGLRPRREEGPTIQIFDTTLRDGTQGEGVSFSAADKLKIARKLDAFGIHFIEGGWPGSNPKDIEFFRLAAKETFRQAMVVAFGSTRRAGVAVEDDLNVRAIVQTGVRGAAIFGKSWDLHVTDALRTTLDENVRMIADTVAYLKSRGLYVIYDAEHFFDGYKANRAYALETIQAAAEAGADVIALCDTNGGSLPYEVKEIVADVRERISTPIGIHAHNDGGLAVANTLAAVRAGAVHVQGTINGYGERCGNVDLVQVIANLQLKMGYRCVPPEKLRGLTDLSRHVSELANRVPNDYQPFVGRSAFAHKGGIHVSAVLRNPQSYEHVPPESVGNERRVLVSELSGASNVVYKIEEFDLDVDKDSPALREVVQQVKRLEHEGYYFEGAEASFKLLLYKALGRYKPAFQLLGLRLMTDKRDNGHFGMAEATIKLKVGEQILHTVAEGNGPVNALDHALRKALEQVYPELREIKLTDYKVRVIDGNSGTGAKVRVLIESAARGRSWGTVGVSTNILEASWQALVDSVEYGLMVLREQQAAKEDDSAAKPASHAG